MRGIAGEAGARLTIDLAALADNWRLLSRRARHSVCAAVVKADAYGTGIEQAVPILNRAGCFTFFVAHLSEARRVRAVAPEARIYVLNGLLPGTASTYAEYSLRPALGSIEEIMEWAGYMRSTGWRGAAALHIDTGMGRLGVTPDLARDIANMSGMPPWSLVMSHLACADEPGHPLNLRQMERFAVLRRLFPDASGSLLNSSGIFLPGDIQYDVVRPGVALFGGNPTPAARNPMRSVVTLEARVIQFQDIQEGHSVGYGATWVAKRPSRIAVLGVGYADGFLRAGSSQPDGTSAEVTVAGRRRPVVGRISMDLTAVDVTGIPQMDLTRGMWVEVIGSDIGVDEVARKAGTIGYEILTALGQRYDRRYIS